MIGLRKVPPYFALSEKILVIGYFYAIYAGEVPDPGNENQTRTFAGGRISGVT